LNRTTAKIPALLGYGAFFAWLYYRYVPLIPAYQAVLAPILVFLLVRTATDARKGLLAFSFIFPLINVLPYFFGIDERIPHAPAALVAFLAFVMGRMTGRIFADPPSSKAPLGLPLKLLAVWGGMSALITFLRYLDFFPWAAPGIHELKVNVAGLSAGGARMSVVFTSASLLSGIAERDGGRRRGRIHPDFCGLECRGGSRFRVVSADRLEHLSDQGKDGPGRGPVEDSLVHR
jgi:hypothetical protein